MFAEPAREERTKKKHGNSYSKRNLDRDPQGWKGQDEVWLRRRALQFRLSL